MPSQTNDPMRALDRPGRRCKARNRKGDQCRQVAIPGGTVCRYHGGAAPQVIEAARRRLAVFVLDSLDVVEEGLKGQDRHGVLVPYAARLKAATEVLDRVGISALKPEQVIRHEVEGQVTAELGPEILRALAETRQLATVHRERALAEGQRRSVGSTGGDFAAVAEPPLRVVEVEEAELVEELPTALEGD